MPGAYEGKFPVGVIAQVGATVDFNDTYDAALEAGMFPRERYDLLNLFTGWVATRQALEHVEALPGVIGVDLEEAPVAARRLHR